MQKYKQPQLPLLETQLASHSSRHARFVSWSVLYRDPVDRLVPQSREQCLPLYMVLLPSWKFQYFNPKEVIRNRQGRLHTCIWQWRLPVLYLEPLELKRFFIYHSRVSHTAGLIYSLSRLWESISIGLPPRDKMALTSFNLFAFPVTNASTSEYFLFFIIVNGISYHSLTY